MNYIELFAGCGGLSLGLEASGFKLLVANELSPMAGESYAYNLLQEDLTGRADSNSMPTRTIWLHSKFKNIKERLRENPFEFPTFEESGYTDFPFKNPEEIKGKLIIGSIIELNKLLETDSKLVGIVKKGFDGNGVDLVSGGPPCQSFSMAGMRKKDCDKNTLPWEFAKFVNHVQPRLVLLENVTGILRPFKDEDGNRFYAWFEVAKAFAEIGYIPLCLHINARFSGVPQNRPRFIMLAFRKDIVERVIENNEGSQPLFNSAIQFFQSIYIEKQIPEYGSLRYFDVANAKDRELILSSFLSSLISQSEVTVREAIDDLKQNHPEPESAYVQKLNSTFDWLKHQDELKNHELRSNNDVVKRRFRIYQVIQRAEDKQVTKDIMEVLKGNCTMISSNTWNIVRSFEFLKLNGKLGYFRSKSEFESYLSEHPTKKQTQKALNPDFPAPAALSIPDDGCHYDERELRVFSVREMARIQSFPDNFVFRSKITTGGKMRRYEVPQYTQVGNAVPPLLGLQLGKVCRHILESINPNQKSTKHLPHTELVSH